MNYFKEAERVLASRGDMVNALSNLERRQNRVIAQGRPAAPLTQDYDKPYVSSSEADSGLTACLEMAEISREIKRTRELIDEVDTVLGQLSPDERRLLVGWYVKGQSKERLAEDLGFSSTTSVYNLRNRAVGRFALLYFGAVALDSI